MDLGTILLVIVAVGLLIALVVVAFRPSRRAVTDGTSSTCSTGGACFLDSLLGCGADKKKDTLASAKATEGVASSTGERTLADAPVTSVPGPPMLPVMPTTLPVAAPTVESAGAPVVMYHDTITPYEDRTHETNGHEHPAPEGLVPEHRASLAPILPADIPALRVQHEDALLATLFSSDAPLLPPNVTKEEFERLVDEYDKRYLTMPKLVIPRTMHFNYDKYTEQQERMDRDMVRHHQQFISRDEVGSLTEELARGQASRLPVTARSFQPRSKARR